MKGVLLRALWLIGVSVVLVTVLWLSALQEKAASAGLSALYTFRGTREPPADVLIVAVDAASARELGVPTRPDLWPRALHAQLIDGLAVSGAVAIGFDLLFEHAGEERDDERLREAIARAGNVLLAERVVRHVLRSDSGGVLGSVDRRIGPMPSLAQVAWATAPFVLPKTDDGVFEFWTFPAGGRASMPVRLYERWLAQRGRQVEIGGAPRDTLGLNLYGPFGSVPIVSYAEALRRLSRGGAPEFAGKVVLVGLAESNQSLQYDAYRTPYSSTDGVDLSGVELAATAVANFIDGSALRRLDPTVAMALVLGWTVLLAVPWGLVRAGEAMFITIALLAGYGVLALQVFVTHFVWLPVIFPLLVVPMVVAGIGMVLKFRQARGRHRRLHRLLAADRHGGALTRLVDGLEGQRPGRVVSAVCLCSDIAAYTTLTEARSADAARNMLNRYLACFVPHIESRGGDVTDIVGDSIMSLWVIGADAGDACRRALAAARALDDCMNRQRPAGALPTRFGLHLGDVYFGEVGVGDRTEIRPVGDVVNTASRIQDACKPLGLTLLASQEVARAAGDQVVCEVGRFLLKGKRDAITLVTIDPSACGEPVHSRFAEALSCFVRGDRAGAQAGFHAVLSRAPDNGPARFYAGLCAAPELPKAGVIELEKQ